MECNVGRNERVVRELVGTFIIGLGMAYTSWWGLVGLALLATAAIGWWPLSAMLGINTCKKRL